ncbi:MAG: endonuclease domain-containing protein [Dehalococcoidia bacterium]|nr:endonuclease domain-containing protein [Dehalococcoidia bacterium]MCA9850385.1 endonuclease domain-containing protein [Dehalococcoidia bacterium]MCB9483128.1 endonuclease domain-containing protein [Dehalococcoidia bacterium]
MGRERARELRRNSTDAERKLWESLRAKRLGGYKFRRQYPVGQYIVDFVCIEQGLAVEIDGDQHAEQAGYDLERTLFLEGENLQVLRFSNREVLTELTNVEQAIWVALTSLSPTLPQWGREPETREGE